MITPQDIQRALLLRRFRLQAPTVKEDISWDVLIPAGGVTHPIRVQCFTGQTALIDWGDNTSTEATATTMTTYSHPYAAGTFTITITGGVRAFMHGASAADYNRTVLVRNMNTPGLYAMGYAFYTGKYLQIDSNCHLASSIVAANVCFKGCLALSYVPLSFWPVGGFTLSYINLAGLFGNCGNITNSIAPSNILWDSGKSFGADRDTFYPNNPTAWLNHASAYTDPVSGITYSKIPYAWGGAAD